jgi:hypothetical protein
MQGLHGVKQCLGLVCLIGVISTSWASIGEYALQGSFTIPSVDGLRCDVLPDGRLVALNGAEVLIESGVGTRTFSSQGLLPGADLPSNEFGFGGAAFLSVSPDGTKLAVGNGGGASFGNYQVGVFPLSSLASGTWFSADHYEAAWYDNTRLAVTAGALAATNVSLLDITSPNPASPSVTTLASNIGGASAGITFDVAGNLYTGNGFQFSGPSGTGAVKAFTAADVAAAIGGVVIDFENTGTVVADVLSANSLGFDSEGNLFVGGGDFFGGTGDFGYAGLIDSAAVADALAGNGAIDELDPSELRRLDPEGSALAGYEITFSDATGELYLRDGGTVYVYAVPEPGSLMLLGLMLLSQVRRR